MSNHNNDFDASWIPVFLLLVFAWPIGLIMLINKIRKSTNPEQKRRKPISWISIGMMLLGAAVLSEGAGLFGTFALLGGVATFFYSRKMKVSERMYLKYANVIGAKPVMPLSAIAAAMPVSYEQAIRDLQKMIDDGYFGTRAYIDHGAGVFITDSRISQNFINKTIKEYGAEPPARAAIRPQQPAGQAQPAPVTIDPRTQVEREFQSKLDGIREANERIKDEDISAKIYRIEQITGNIFDLVKEKPGKRSEIHTFMNYYLPTTLKLLNSYSVLERQNVLGQNIVSSKENIEKMVDQLVFAFEQQLDQMFESEARDINTDITVMERMLARDGLAENNPYCFPKMPLEAKPEPSPFQTPSDFGTAQAVAEQKQQERN